MVTTISKFSAFIIILFFCALFCGTSCTNTSTSFDDADVLDSLLDVERSLLYGIQEHLYDVEVHTVPRNSSLSDILRATDLSGQQIFSLVQSLDTVFNVRRIRAGNKYALFYESQDSLKELAFFVYEISTTDFFVSDVRNRDSIVSHRDVKDITVVEKQAKGEIESSLWNATVGQGLPISLSLELSEIYSWTIDFFGLQKGDAFRLVYTERYVDSVSVGLDAIAYAVFTHRGKDIYAIPFEQDSIVSFYDSLGLSLRKAFLKAPLRYARISSHFSNARMHPVLRTVRAHHGIDYAAPTGTPVMTIGDGVVIRRGYFGAAGNMVRIRHNSTYETAYLHLSRFGKGIAVGTRVTQGQIIGYVGSTGLSTGPHLDFRVYKNGTPINPLHLESPPVEPVQEDNIPAFNLIRDSLIQILQKI